MLDVKNDLLREDLQALDATHPVTVLGLEANHYGVTLSIDNPAGFTVVAADQPDEVPSTKLTMLWRLNEQFPHSRPDMFWLRPFLKLPSGNWPAAGDHFEVIHGKRWQRFSWHLKDPWVPGRHHLEDHYLPFARTRLQQVL